MGRHVLFVVTLIVKHTITLLEFALEELRTRDFFLYKRRHLFDLLLRLRD